MKINNKIYLTLAGYTLIGAIAFGHAQNNIKITTTQNGYSEVEVRAIKIIFSSIFWPLYLSVKLQEDRSVK